MSFPKYERYKDSGVEWLGEVPYSWSIGTFKNMAWIRNGKEYKLVEDPEGKYPVFGSGGQFAMATEYLYDGESVLLGRKGTIDKPLYVNGKFWTIDTMFYTEILDLTNPRFLYYLSLTIPFFYYSTSTALPSMTQEDLLNHSIAIPTFIEQQKIAEFLDYETGRIDALIGEQERLIALLKEKRQAVISHAVTKGLDPNAPLKDSGIDWLGQIPAHWDVINFQLVVSITEGQVDPTKVPYSGMFLIAPNHIESATGRIIAMETAEDQEASSGKYFCNAGDVVYSKIRPGLRKVCIAPVDSLCSADMYPMYGHSGMTNSYLFWFFLSEQFSTFALLESDRVAMPKINRESLGKLRIIRPSLSEQTEIVGYLEIETHRIDNLLEQAKQGVQLLQERRSALISAAVTGKIDLRHWQPPTPNPQ